MYERASKRLEYIEKNKDLAIGSKKLAIPLGGGKR